MTTSHDGRPRPWAAVQATVGRSWKLVLALATGLGVWAFFLPIHRHHVGDLAVEVSAYRILNGFEAATQVDPDAARLDAHDQERLLANVNELVQNEGRPDPHHIGEIKNTPSWVPFYFLTVVGLALITLVVLIRRNLGPLTSAGALVLGLGAIGLVLRELVIDRHGVSELGARASTTAYGGAVLAIAGALAMIAGIGGLLVADPGGFRGPPRDPRIPAARVV